MTRIPDDAELEAMLARGSENSGHYSRPEIRASLNDIRTLVAEVRALRAELATCGEAYEAQVGYLRGINDDYDELRAAMIPRWTTTPPGPEHEGRWFWVRWPDGDEVVWQYIPDLPNNPVFVAWSGPLPEPEPGE